MEDNEALMSIGAGDATLAALILAQKLGISPTVKQAAAHDASNPDPASFMKQGGFVGDTGQDSLNRSFETLAKEANPDFNPQAQMLETRIDPDYVNYPGAMARNSKVDPETFTIKHNPGVDRAVYAHELGHVLGQNTPVARQINDVRKFLQVNPSLTKAIDKGLEIFPEGTAKSLKNATRPYSLFKGARYLAPGIAAGLTEGDDDLATSVALSLAMSSPILLDEGIASMNALKIMDNAGQKASPLQRRRLAAAWGDYLAPALIAGLSGNVVGNFLD